MTKRHLISETSETSEYTKYQIGINYHIMIFAEDKRREIVKKQKTVFQSEIKTGSLTFV